MNAPLDGKASACSNQREQTKKASDDGFPRETVGREAGWSGRLQKDDLKDQAKRILGMRKPPLRSGSLFSRRLRRRSKRKLPEELLELWEKVLESYLARDLRSQGRNTGSQNLADSGDPKDLALIRSGSSTIPIGMDLSRDLSGALLLGINGHLCRFSGAPR